jgi:hypothetical protein
VTGAPGERGDRDLEDVHALITDRYLDSILAAHGRGADVAPILTRDLPAHDIWHVAARLARELPRFHPSFRFEEALAAKLAEAAARMRLPLAAGGEERAGSIVSLETTPLHAIEADDDALVPGAARQVIGRELLIGGALTSAALSIAGAAYVAWRIRHPQSSPMARAVRAVSRTRLA